MATSLNKSADGIVERWLLVQFAAGPHCGRSTLSDVRPSTESRVRENRPCIAERGEIEPILCSLPPSIRSPAVVVVARRLSIENRAHISPTWKLTNVHGFEYFTSLLVPLK